MISPIWSFALTFIGVTGLFFTMRKSIWGPIIGVSVQLLWIAYAIFTIQYGFLISAAAYGAVNIYGIIRWNRERKQNMLQ